MFPIDIATGSYDARILAQFDQLVGDAGLDLRLAELLPTIRLAGEQGGQLSATGTKLLDPTGRLRPGVPMCPPEGDAGTGTSRMDAACAFDRRLLANITAAGSTPAASRKSAFLLTCRLSGRWLR
jgi:hypothetical protein